MANTYESAVIFPAGKRDNLSDFFPKPENSVKAERKRPFKVWSSDCTIKKSVVVSSLKDLINEGCGKLKIRPPVRIVLEEDGTEVDDEEYFSCLPDDTIVLLVSDSTGCDEIDTAITSDNTQKSILHLAKTLKKNLQNILLFKDEELELLVNVDTGELAQYLGSSKSSASSIQESCQRHLDDKAQAKESQKLLELYHQANVKSSHTNNTDKKRKFDDR